mmetsp:Transcript_13380/g.36965  ORF Transcript_13380/g.36965 Transcript_13380/m.36965 type:complete len:298 (-) Transcript_13380:389-1282(-)
MAPRPTRAPHTCSAPNFNAAGSEDDLLGPLCALPLPAHQVVQQTAFAQACKLNQADGHCGEEQGQALDVQHPRDVQGLVLQGPSGLALARDLIVVLREEGGRVAANLPGLVHRAQRDDLHRRLLTHDRCYMLRGKHTEASVFMPLLHAPRCHVVQCTHEPHRALRGGRCCRHRAGSHHLHEPRFRDWQIPNRSCSLRGIGSWLSQRGDVHGHRHALELRAEARALVPALQRPEETGVWLRLLVARALLDAVQLSTLWLRAQQLQDHGVLKQTLCLGSIITVKEEVVVCCQRFPCQRL